MAFTLTFTSCQSTADIEKDSDNKVTQVIISKEEPLSPLLPPYTQPPQTAKKETAPTRMEQQKKNKKGFYKKAQAQDIDTLTIDTCWQALCTDNCFQNGALALTELCIADIDSNGQTDMLIRVADAQHPQDYGSGALWFYLNEDTPYAFCDEWCPYCGDCWLFWEDIDNDTHTEIVFCAQGTGVGATGDMYKAVFKYKNHAIEQMRLPSDMAEDDGFAVEIIQNPEQNSYSAYCPYFDEQISFHAENMDGKEPPATPQTVGRNVRGFYDLRIAEYQGKKALQASEYLCGEGAVPHYVIRVWTAQSPVTFDRTSGEVLSLEDILGMPEQECIIMLTSSAYKYMEAIGRETFYLDRRDFLTNLYDPTHFFVCSDGIGIHYERYDIDCGAAGDYLFVIPYENFAANGGETCSPCR